MATGDWFIRGREFAVSIIIYRKHTQKVDVHILAKQHIADLTDFGQSIASNEQRDAVTARAQPTVTADSAAARSPPPAATTVSQLRYRDRILRPLLAHRPWSRRRQPLR